MTSLPVQEDVKQWEVLMWAIEQARHLKPAQNHLLLYLCCQAAYRSSTGRDPGVLPPSLSSYAAMQRGTGMGRTTVYNTLQGLFQAGYVFVNMAPSNQKTSRIRVLWDEAWDQIRDDARRGIKPLPKEFHTTAKVFVRAMEKASIADLQKHRQRRSVRSESE